MAQAQTQHQQLRNDSSSVWKYWNPWKEMESNSAGGVEKPINWPTSSLMCLLPWSSSHPLRTSQLIKSHPHLPTSLAANQTNKSTYQPKQTTYLTTITYQPTWQPTKPTNQPNQPANKNKSITAAKSRCEWSNEHGVFLKINPILKMTRMARQSQRAPYPTKSPSLWVKACPDQQSTKDIVHMKVSTGT